LKTKITLNKNIELKGLNKLNGFSIDSARLIIPPLAEGTNILGNATLPNPSIVNFNLGNVTINMFVGDVVVGQALIENANLAPGNNTVALRGTIDINTAISQLEYILNQEAVPLEDGMIQVTATGNSTIFNGVHIDYYEDVLNNLTLSASMSIVDVLVDTIGGAIGSSSSEISSILGSLGGSSTILQLIDSLSSVAGDIGL